MSDIWADINEMVPEYMSAVCAKYDMRCVRISTVESVLYNSNCCLLIKIGRLYPVILYIRKEKKGLTAYDCGSYWAMRFDADDRQNLIPIEKAGDNVKNELSVMASGFFTKCEDVFTGDSKWFAKYKESSRYSVERLDENEIKHLEECFG